MPLSLLRAETREHHRRIEADIDLLEPGLTAERYVGWLAAFRGFHAPWEALAAPVLERALRGFFEPRRKLWRIDADLRHFGVDASAAAALPRCTRLPALHSVPAVLGSLYVLEGATLGGQLIARHLRATLGLTGIDGRRFFSSYAERVGPMWREFGEVLARGVAGGEAEAVQSAVETFTALHEWLLAARPGCARGSAA